jgi:hypothetical protein
VVLRSLGLHLLLRVQQVPLLRLQRPALIHLRPAQQQQQQLVAVMVPLVVGLVALDGGKYKLGRFHRSSRRK